MVSSFSCLELCQFVLQFVVARSWARAIRCATFDDILGSHWGDAGNSTSMSSGSGDEEAKSEVEESLLRWRLHGVEGSA